MSLDLDGSYAVVATAPVTCLAGVFMLKNGKIIGRDSGGYRYEGDVCEQDDFIDFTLTVEILPPDFSAKSGLPVEICQPFQLTKSYSLDEWETGRSTYLKDSGTWLMIRRIADPHSLRNEPRQVQFSPEFVNGLAVG